VLLAYSLYGAINVALVWASEGWQLTALFALYGVFFAIDESQSKAFIAYLEPERRATAVGAYNFVTGVLYLPASLVAGALWSVDPRWAFGLAALLTVAAIVLFGRMQPAADLSPSKAAAPAAAR
jgi:MFS family permease